ncbi:MAG: DUF4124 domain-containing protein [Ectothiorhodospiraceae bacterium]|nr:DUF4124 domain-containing protein [Ectothiorhodospiraceae bacterium]MCH8504365.1 DUF4124 domain-containing protein [Ectothiorhodospiraceae bacterium]
MEARKIILAAALAMSAAVVVGTASAANIYRWTGEDGTTHYGSNPPPDVEAERIRGASPPPSGSAGDAGTQQRDASTGSVSRQEERADASSGEQELEQECARARQNLEILEDPAVRRVRTDGGEVQPLTEERRQEMIEKNRQFLEDWC